MYIILSSVCSSYWPCGWHMSRGELCGIRTGRLAVMIIDDL